MDGVDIDMASDWVISDFNLGNDNMFIVGMGVVFFLFFSMLEIYFEMIVDFNDNVNVCFVKIKNGGISGVDLIGWVLCCWINGNSDFFINVDISLSLIGMFVVGSCVYIVKDVDDFEIVYGFVFDIDGGVNGFVDSNGDD